MFSLSQLRLQLAADGGYTDAAGVVELRKNSNQVLATIILGNVSTNVQLTLLRFDTCRHYAFLFSAAVITLVIALQSRIEVGPRVHCRERDVNHSSTQKGGKPDGERRLGRVSADFRAEAAHRSEMMSPTIPI